MRFWARTYRVVVCLCLLTAGCGEQNDDSVKPENTTASSAPNKGSANTETQDSATKDTTPDESSKTSEQDPKDSEISPTWENFGDAFLRNWCKGCHSPELEGPARFGAPEGVDLVTLEDLRNWQSRVSARATGDAPSMPPAGRPSKEDLVRLKQWLDAGAP